MRYNHYAVVGESYVPQFKIIAATFWSQSFCGINNCKHAGCFGLTVGGVLDDFNVCQYKLTKVGGVERKITKLQIYQCFQNIYSNDAVYDVQLTALV